MPVLVHSDPRHPGFVCLRPGRAQTLVACRFASPTHQAPWTANLQECRTGESIRSLASFAPAPWATLHTVPCKALRTGHFGRPPDKTDGLLCSCAPLSALIGAEAAPAIGVTTERRATLPSLDAQRGISTISCASLRATRTGNTAERAAAMAVLSPARKLPPTGRLASLGSPKRSLTAE
jgi:hypothetical protein